MDCRKLFQVLVIGGAMLGCTESVQTLDSGPTNEGGDSSASDARAPAADSTVLAQDSDASVPTNGDPVDCGFCPNEVCCESDESGSSELRDGFVCCWGTSC